MLELAASFTTAGAMGKINQFVERPDLKIALHDFELVGGKVAFKHASSANILTMEAC